MRQTQRVKKLKFEPCLKNVLPFYICISQTVIDLPNYGPGIYFITACKRAHGYQKGHISKVRIGFYSVFYHFFSLLWLFIKCTSWCFFIIIYQRKPNNPIWRQKNPPQQWFCLNTIIQFFKLCWQTFSSVSLFFSAELPASHLPTPSGGRQRQVLAWPASEIEQKACHWRNDSLNFILMQKKLNFLTTVRITFFKTHCDSPNSFCHIFVDPSHSYFSRKYAPTVLHNWMLHNLSAFFWINS